MVLVDEKSLHFLSTFRHSFSLNYFPDAFIQSNLQCIQVIHSVSMCVPWELNPQPLRCKSLWIKASAKCIHLNVDACNTNTHSGSPASFT